jgi:hypothetical protein
LPSDFTISIITHREIEREELQLFGDRSDYKGAVIKRIKAGQKICAAKEVGRRGHWNRLAAVQIFLVLSSRAVLLPFLFSQESR